MTPKPAPYLARAKWVLLQSQKAMDPELRARLGGAHRLVVDKPPRKFRP